MPEITKALVLVVGALALCGRPVDAEPGLQLLAEATESAAAAPGAVTVLFANLQSKIQQQLEADYPDYRRTYTSTAVDVDARFDEFRSIERVGPRSVQIVTKWSIKVNPLLAPRFTSDLVVTAELSASVAGKTELGLEPSVTLRFSNVLLKPFAGLVNGTVARVLKDRFGTIDVRQYAELPEGAAIDRLETTAEAFVIRF